MYEYDNLDVDCEKQFSQNRSYFFERKCDGYNSFLCEAKLVDTLRYLHLEKQVVFIYGIPLFANMLPHRLLSFELFKAFLSKCIRNPYKLLQ